MHKQYINAPNAHDLKTGYSQALLVSQAEQLLFVSGQIPVRKDGSVPGTFREQAQQAWSNVAAQLAEAGMDMGNVVKHTTYLSDRKFRRENSEVRREVLGDYQPALTVIIAGIFDEEWLLEIEAVAAK